MQRTESRTPRRSNLFRVAFVLAVASVASMAIPLNPSAEAVTLPSETDTIDNFETDGDVAASQVAPDSLAGNEVDGTEPGGTPEGSSAEDVPSSVVEAPIAFSMIGFELPEGARVAFRTSDGDQWTSWTLAEALGEDDGPDPGSAEDGAANSRPTTDPYWVEAATHVQIRVEGASPEDVTAHLVDSNGLSASMIDRFKAATSRPLMDASPPAAHAATRPSVRSRSEWDPRGECQPRRSPSYASSVRNVIVHHTAGSNTYSDGKAVVLGICRYHRNANGWNDIGYNALVDRFGNVYEGRQGGLERAVIGAHAAGFNTGSFGIGVMGNFENASVPAAAFDATARTIAWKSRLHGIDATGRVRVNNRTINTIVGHRDVGSTACPGQRFYNRLGELRSNVGSRLASAPSFSDISGSHAPFIRDIAARGITAGCGGSRYCPDRNVTRAQMATFLQRAEGSQRPRWASGFSDVPATSTHSPDINAIADAGWTNSCNSASGGDLFCPGRAVTRAEMATFIVRAHPRLEPNPSGNRFSDVPQGLSHRPFINALADAGITVGCNGGSGYCPDRPVTRAEMATFISRAMDAGMGG